MGKSEEDNKTMKINFVQRKILLEYLKRFYECYPQEKYSIIQFVRYFKLRLKDNKDAWMGVCGETRNGKSLFVVMSQILFGRPYDLTKNIAFIPKGNEITDKFSKLRFNTLLIDEAAKEMRSVNWHSKAQQGVNEKAMTDAFMNNWVFLNMPNFNEFTKSMKRSNLLFRAIVIYRTDLYARIVIQRKTANWRSDDPWCDVMASKRYEATQKRMGGLSNEDILRIERALPSTIMDFIIPNLEMILPKVTDEYNRLKVESRIERDINESTGKKNIYKDKYQELLNKVSKILVLNRLNLGKIKVTKGEISKALGISPSTLNEYLNQPETKQKEVFGRKGVDM